MEIKEKTKSNLKNEKPASRVPYTDEDRPDTSDDRETEIERKKK